MPFELGVGSNDTFLPARQGQIISDCEFQGGTSFVKQNAFTQQWAQP